MSMKFTYTSQKIPFATSNEKKHRVYLFLLSQHALLSCIFKTSRSIFATKDPLTEDGRERLTTCSLPLGGHQIAAMIN
jgi:hypothetical protein